MSDHKTSLNLRIEVPRNDFLAMLNEQTLYVPNPPKDYGTSAQQLELLEDLSRYYIGTLLDKKSIELPEGVTAKEVKNLIQKSGSGLNLYEANYSEMPIAKRALRQLYPPNHPVKFLTGPPEQLFSYANDVRMADFSLRIFLALAPTGITCVYQGLLTGSPKILLAGFFFLTLALAAFMVYDLNTASVDMPVDYTDVIRLNKNNSLIVAVDMYEKARILKTDKPWTSRPDNRETDFNHIGPNSSESGIREYMMHLSLPTGTHPWQRLLWNLDYVNSLTHTTQQVRKKINERLKTIISLEKDSLSSLTKDELEKAIKDLKNQLEKETTESWKEALEEGGEKSSINSLKYTIKEEEKYLVQLEELQKKLSKMGYPEYLYWLVMHKDPFAILKKGR